jgi:hypothetical protein
MSMRGRRLYPRELGTPVPPLAVTFFRGWGTWLVGWDYEKHVWEWTLMVHLGPFAVAIHRVR